MKHAMVPFIHYLEVEFAKFADFGKQIMRDIKYDLDSPLLKDIVIEHSEQIMEIYGLIFGVDGRGDGHSDHLGLPRPGRELGFGIETRNSKILKKCRS